MARPIWSGVISFGLVSVPVAMFSATRDHEVSFHQFEQGTGDRIRYQRVNERTGKEVDYADIVKGADIGDGQYVMLNADELDAVAPGRSRSLDIHRFVDLDDIDPIYFQKTYYLAPGTDETVKTYALLRDAMAASNRAAVATLVMRGKEYLAAVRADGDLLVLETMFFADEVRDAHKELDRLPGRVQLRREELAMARQLIESMVGPWKPTEYHDTYTERVQALIDAKVKGAEVTPAAEAPAATEASDLMEVLRRSVEAARTKKPTDAKPAPTKAAHTKAAHTKATPTKATHTKATHTKAAPRTTNAAPDVHAMSKTDLMAAARKLDVPGRSTMTRPQLEKAVAAAA
jgi:DNA end-binding protein Ku